MISTGKLVHIEEPGECYAELARIVDSVQVSRSTLTDAYLAAFAISANLRMVTFDKDFERFPGLQLLKLG